MKHLNAKNKFLTGKSMHQIKKIRIDNYSLKVIKGNDNRFLLLIKEHYFGIPITRQEDVVEDCESAEDCIGSVKVEYFKIVEFRDNVRKIFSNP
jgi:hypothetical protein